MAFLAGLDSPVSQGRPIDGAAQFQVVNAGGVYVLQRRYYSVWTFWGAWSSACNQSGPMRIDQLMVVVCSNNGGESYTVTSGGILMVKGMTNPVLFPWQ